MHGVGADAPAGQKAPKGQGAPAPTVPSAQNEPAEQATLDTLITTPACQRPSPGAAAKSCITTGVPYGAVTDHDELLCEKPAAVHPPVASLMAGGTGLACGWRNDVRAAPMPKKM